LDCLQGYLLLGKKLLEEKEKFSGSWNFAPYSFESKTVEEVAVISKSVWADIQIEFEKPEMDHHEATTLKLDNTKAISLLGWQPKWNTQKAIEETISWYKAFYTNNYVQTNEQINKYFV